MFLLIKLIIDEPIIKRMKNEDKILIIIDPHVISNKHVDYISIICETFKHVNCYNLLMTLIRFVLWLINVERY